MEFYGIFIILSSQSKRGKSCWLLNGLNSANFNSSHSVFVRARVVLKRTVVGDCRRFDDLSGSHPQGQVNSVFQSILLSVWSVERYS